MINYNKIFNINNKNDLEIDFVLTNDEFRKLITDNFGKESSVYSFFINKTTETESFEINDFLIFLHDTDYDAFEKLSSILYAFYEYNNFPLIIN